MPETANSSISYIEMLRTSARRVGNCTCMGLDPIIEVLPESQKDIRSRLTSFFESLFKAMISRGLRPAAFKPNIGYYAVLDRPREHVFDGSLALADIFDMLRALFPNIPVILDSKRGDIARSSENYAKEAFDCWNADAITISPFMGSDSVGPFEKANDGKRGVYVLTRTSNPGARDVQGLPTVDPVDEKDIYPLHKAVAILVSSCANDRPGTGAVVGATSIRELGEIAAWFSQKEIPMLIPGVGAQGATAPITMEVLQTAGYELPLARINSSSALTHPWKTGPAPSDHIDRCLHNIDRMLRETAL